MAKRETVTVYRDLMGEGLHVAFRKASDHPNAGKIWRLIQDLPDEEWAQIIDFVLDGAAVN